MADAMTVELVRLCECEGNKKELVVRHGSLTDTGVEQAEALRMRLQVEAERKGSAGVAQVFAPGNSACQQTARIIGGTRPVETADEFREPPYPDWAGKLLDQIKIKYPAEWERYFNPQPGDADRVLVQGGESFRATYERAKSGLDRIYREHGAAGHVAVVTHGEIVRMLVLGLLDAPLEHLFRLRGRNGAVTTFSYDGTTAVFERINDSAHLDEIGSKDIRSYVASRE